MAQGAAFSEGVDGFRAGSGGAPAAAAFREPPWCFVSHFGKQEGETQTGGFRLDSLGTTHQRSEVEPLVKPGEGKENLEGERTMRTGLNKSLEFEITPHFSPKERGGVGVRSALQ